MTLSEVRSDEYFRKQKHKPERYPSPEKQQQYLENVKRQGAELFMLHLPTEYYGDLEMRKLNAKLTPLIVQGQPLGSDRFCDAMCAAVGIRRSRKSPVRPAASPDQTSGTETQPDFGF